VPLWRASAMERMTHSVWIAVVLVSTSGCDGTHAAPTGRECSRDMLISQWRHAPTPDGASPTPTARQEVADRLVACHALRGWALRNVRDAFGTPDEIGSASGARAVGIPTCLSYFIGTGRGFGPDYEYLRVVFSARGRVIRAVVGQD